MSKRNFIFIYIYLYIYINISISRGKIGLHYGLQRCNAQRAALACGCREYLLPLVGMPGTRRADALHEACWCLALYKSRRWNEAKEASEQRVEGTLIKWRLKIEDWKFLRPVLKTRWRSNKRQSRAGSKRHSWAENWKPREKTWQNRCLKNILRF